MNYSEKLKSCSDEYPFDYWLEDYKEGIGLYSEEHCSTVKAIFDELIASLINLGKDAPEPAKLEAFKTAVYSLNFIRNSDPSLIETMEREEFCELFDKIASAALLESKKFGDGEGIASEWREW